MSRKPPKKPKPAKLPRGVCRYCGCAESDACVDSFEGSCSWTDKARTVCSACRALSDRTKAMDLWGLLVKQEDGTFDYFAEVSDTVRQFPAPFYTEIDAVYAAMEERQNGLECRVVRLVPVDHGPLGSQKS